MNKISYTNLKLKINTETKIFDFNGNQIEVLQYLPIKDKNDLIKITMQESKEGYLYNPIKLDLHFNLNIVYLYTNINFTEKQKEDENKLYDSLVSNGLMELILQNIPKEEYNELLEYLENNIQDEIKYKSTFLGILEDTISSLSLDPDKIQKLIGDVDFNKYTEAINFAKAVNNNNISK